jgi:hypothetical protein
MSDRHDDELRDVLWHASGDDTDTGDALLQVEARVRRIRRRRMDLAGVGILVALVVTLAIASRSHHESPIRPASNVTVASPVSDPAPTTPPTTTPRGTTAAPSGTAEAAIPVAPAPADTTPTPETAPPETAAPEEPAGDDAAAASEPEQDTPTATAPRSPRAPRIQQTFTASGGQLTVSVKNGSLTVVSATPRQGFIVGRPTTTANSVDVEFRSRRGKSRIHVDLVVGQLQPTVTDENGYGGHSDDDRIQWTTTTTTPADNHESDSPWGSGDRTSRQRTDSSTSTQRG